jgi:hypothetical protein
VCHAVKVGTLEATAWFAPSTQQIEINKIAEVLQHALTVKWPNIQIMMRSITAKFAMRELLIRTLGKWYAPIAATRLIQSNKHLSAKIAPGGHMLQEPRVFRARHALLSKWDLDFSIQASV